MKKNKQRKKAPKGQRWQNPLQRNEINPLWLREEEAQDRWNKD